MKVTLVGHTPNPENIIAASAKMCYSSVATLETLLNNKNNSEFIEMLMDMKHESPFEHVSFTFVIEDISRACSHQLVRHRLASFSQRSQRYCSEDETKYVTPHNLTPEQAQLYEASMKTIFSTYKTLVMMGMKKEDARMVLPNATCTRLVMTMNVRELIHFFGLRCCTRAQWEIRELANSMLHECRKVLPTVFNNVGSSCINLGYCPEGDKCCGKAPTLEVLKAGE